MNKETILALLKSLTNPEVEKHLAVGASAIDYERLFKVLAPFLITILENTILDSRDVWYGHQRDAWHGPQRTAMGVSTIRKPNGEVVNYDDLRGGRCIP
jgi:hypothetical protein